MPKVTIELPSLLAATIGGIRSLEVEADTLEAAFAALGATHPQLTVHLFDESGRLRPHVLCFLNNQNTRWSEAKDRSLEDGDTLTFIQAVSGG